MHWSKFVKMHCNTISIMKQSQSFTMGKHPNIEYVYILYSQSKHHVFSVKTFKKRFR